MSQQSALPSLESPIPNHGSTDIVLAFSGGLDTSFCVPWLQQRGWAVQTVFVDTGGRGPYGPAAIQEARKGGGEAKEEWGVGKVWGRRSITRNKTEQKQK